MIKKIKTALKKHYISLILIVTMLFGFATTYVLAVPQVVEIKAKVVNVRTGPMLSYNVIGQLKSGDKIPILKVKNGWYLVRLKGDKMGWIASWLTDSAEIDSATNAIGIINTDQTNVRLYASTQSPIIKVLNRGDKINVVYSKKSWSQIIIDGKVGWVHNQLFALTNEGTSGQQKSLSTVYVLEPNTRIHLKANLSAPVLKTLKQQEELTVLGSEGDFYRVKDQKNTVGYVTRRYVTTEIPSQIQISRPKSLAETTIIIDPGHGGNDPGAQANDQVHYEKKYTMLVAQALKEKLTPYGGKVIMTREGDQSVELGARVQMTNRIKPSAFISLHLDSTPQTNQAQGITTYYYSRRNDLPLARSISAQFDQLKTPNRGVAFGDYQVLRDSFYPSILIELGYINDDHDLALIKSAHYRDQLTAKIVSGLADYFK